MNSCMRQQGQMNRNKNYYAQTAGCQEMTECRPDCSYENEKNFDINKYPIAMSYVPWQQWRNVVDGCKGLEQGTIFDELSLGFHCANKNCQNGCMPGKLPDNSCMQNVTDCNCRNKW